MSKYCSFDSQIGYIVNSLDDESNKEISIIDLINNTKLQKKIKKNKK